MHKKQRHREELYNYIPSE